jgi:PAS domain S-box-containing protein
MLSITLYLFVRETEIARLTEEFNRRAAGRHALIKEGLRGYEECIYNLRSLFANSDEVTPEEFNSAAIDIRSRRPDIQAIEWVPVVSSAERTKIELFARQQISPDFTVKDRSPDGHWSPAATRDIYYPILYINPIKGNEAALGYDLGVADNRRDLAAAIKSHTLTMTGKVRLVQSGDATDQFSLIMGCPVFQTDEKNRETFIGLVQILFRLDDMIGQSWRSYSSNVMDTLIEDVSTQNPADRFLFSRLSDYLPDRPPLRSAADLAPSPRQELTLDIAGRKWRCLYALPPGWISHQMSYTPLLVLFGGLVFTLVLGAYVHQVRRQTELVTSQVHERTAELRHTQNLLETDIAKRRATEAELRESRRQLESLLGQLPGMAYRCSNTNRYAPIFISHGSMDIVGLHPSELLTAETLRFPDLILKDDFPRCRSAFYEAIKSRQPYEIEYRVHHKNGSIKWVLDRGQGIYSIDNELLSVEGLVVDITARKEAEREKISLAKKLLETQKLESLGVLAGGLAHDFNNLLMGIMGNANLISLDIPPQSPLLRNLTQIETASQRAAELCQQMLAYAGKGRFLVQPIDIEDIVRNTVPLLEHSISKRASLRFNFTPGLPLVNADITQIRQIIMNLVVNASDAIGDHDGFITLTTGRIAKNDPRLCDAVLIPDSPESEFIYLQVADTGTGMSAETIDKIFDPFFTTKFTGRGLGLAAVMGIVRSHHGGLMVTSHLGQGSAFTLLLPAGETHAKSKRSRSPFESGITREGTVLIIDDEEAVRTVTAHMFRMLGMTPLIACDGVEGLEVFRRHQQEITLVLLDLTMPRMSGEETLGKLRTLSTIVPVIITSGYNRTTLTSPLASAPTVTFLQKPFALAALIEQMEEVMPV